MCLRKRGGTRYEGSVSRPVPKALASGLSLVRTMAGLPAPTVEEAILLEGKRQRSRSTLGEEGSG